MRRIKRMARILELRITCLFVLLCFFLMEVWIHTPQSISTTSKTASKFLSRTNINHRALAAGPRIFQSSLLSDLDADMPPTVRLLQIESKEIQNHQIVEDMLGEKRAKMFMNTSDNSTLDKYRMPAYDWIINNRTLCEGDPRLSFIIAIESAPTHFMARQTLRNTWARADNFNG